MIDIWTRLTGFVDSPVPMGYFLVVAALLLVFIIMVAKRVGAD